MVAGVSCFDASKNARRQDSALMNYMYEATYLLFAIAGAMKHSKLSLLRSKTGTRS
jgi:hypothetical protein